VARDKPVSPSLLMVGEVVRFYRADLQVGMQVQAVG
jgi:uroporphyrin-III C-methyltransferase